ncbi:MAG: periplasmic heavy metal sensor [Chitinophagaceae bacterium]
MSLTSKNKLLTWLVILLLLANAATITMFWLNRKQRPPAPKGSPKEFLVNELKLDAKQQEQLEALMKAHRQAAEEIRGKVKAAKDSLFALVSRPEAPDSVKQTTAAAAGHYLEQLDVLTLNNFQQIRALCNPVQQKKFDEIIQEVLRMMSQPRPGGPGGQGGPGGPGMPPPDAEPPPPGQ